MPKHTWSITLNPYDPSGQHHKTVKADVCYIDNGAVCFYLRGEKTEEDLYPENILTAYIPTDRVLEIEILDNETGEPIGFLFQRGN